MLLLNFHHYFCRYYFQRFLTAFLRTDLLTFLFNFLILLVLSKTLFFPTFKAPLLFSLFFQKCLQHFYYQSPHFGHSFCFQLKSQLHFFVSIFFCRSDILIRAVLDLNKQLNILSLKKRLTQKTRCGPLLKKLFLESFLT